MPLQREVVLETLKTIVDPLTGDDLVGSGMMRGLSVGADAVRFVMEIDPGRVDAMEQLRAQAEEKLKALDGCAGVNIVLTAPSASAQNASVESSPAEQTPAPAARSKSEPVPIRAAPSPNKGKGPHKVPGVERIIAIASGKGGVGKSTVTTNLACALAAQGRRVGLLDADVYGPSQPRMLGVSGRPSSPDGQTILPVRNHGVTMISIGLMTGEDQAVAWRGPMLMGALEQMMSQVQWGALDVLLVDLPPGTGDVQMTLGQKFVVDGAIVVSTPQDIALMDARKGIDMFKQMNVPMLGLIENMSTHVCSQCGHEEHIFGHGGVANEAQKLGTPLLAEIPLHLEIRTAADGGKPVVISNPQSPQADVFSALAKNLIAGGNA